MMCDVCKSNEATVHLTQIVDKKTKKIDLCASCAKEKGVDDPTGYTLADLLLQLGSNPESSTPAAAEEGSDLKCPNCGFTQADFKKNGRLGCSECYLIFSDGLDNLLRTMHKGTRHVGKVPFSFRQTQDLSDKLKTVQKRLDKAITDENFEEAAILRDEVKSLRSKLKEAAVR